MVKFEYDQGSPCLFIVAAFKGGGITIPQVLKEVWPWFDGEGI